MPTQWYSSNRGDILPNAPWHWRAFPWDGTDLLKVFNPDFRHPRDVPEPLRANRLLFPETGFYHVMTRDCVLSVRHTLKMPTFWFLYINLCRCSTWEDGVREIALLMDGKLICQD